MRILKNNRNILAVLLCGILVLPALTQAPSASAEAVGQANLRANTDVNAIKVGEIQSGTTYPVLGRSELYPWYLLGDPTTLRPVGWVFADLVTVRGDINSVPFSNVIVDPNAVTANPLDSTQPSIDATTGAGPIQSLPSATPSPAFNVAGIVRGEVNIRYGPGVDYPRIGVAQAGERFQITGYHTQFPWVRIHFDQSPNGAGWIAQELLEIEGNIFSLEAVTSATLLLPTLTPTPSVLAAASRDGDTTTLSPAFARLGDQLWNIVLSAGFDPQTSRFGSLFLLDLQTGESITFGTEFAFSGTSINKVAILARLYAQLQDPPDARTATDIANTMICSENAATNRLLSLIGQGDEFLGADEVTRFLRQLGLDHTYILTPYTLDPNQPVVSPRPLFIPQTGVDQRKANPDQTNQLTVDDMGWLLADIYQCAYEDAGPLIEDMSGAFDGRECRQMLHVMSSNNVDALLKAGVPEDTRVAHKHGWIFDTHGNAGVFFTPGGNYVLVMMLHQPTWLEYAQSLPVIAEVSRTVYNYYNPGAPLPAIRDGFIPDAPTCNFANTPLVVDLRQPVWDQ